MKCKKCFKCIDTPKTINMQSLKLFKTLKDRHLSTFLYQNHLKFNYRYNRQAYLRNLPIDTIWANCTVLYQRKLGTKKREIIINFLFVLCVNVMFLFRFKSLFFSVCLCINETRTNCAVASIVVVRIGLCSGQF